MTRKKWSTDDETFVLTNKDTVPAAAIAQHLGRTVISIQSKIQDLKKIDYKRSGTKWRVVDLNTLMKNIDMDNSEICAILQRGPKEVDRMRFAIRRAATERNDKMPTAKSLVKDKSVLNVIDVSFSMGKKVTIKPITKEVAKKFTASKPAADKHVKPVDKCSSCNITTCDMHPQYKAAKKAVAKPAVVKPKSDIVGSMTVADLVARMNDEKPEFKKTVSAIKALFPQKHTSAARIIMNGQAKDSKATAVVGNLADITDLSKVSSAMNIALAKARMTLIDYIDKSSL